MWLDPKECICYNNPTISQRDMANLDENIKNEISPKITSLICLF